MGFSDVDSDNKPVSFQQTCEAKRSTHLQELQQKEDEMRQMFVARVKETEAGLKEAEKEVKNAKIHTINWAGELCEYLTPLRYIPSILVETEMFP